MPGAPAGPAGVALASPSEETEQALDALREGELVVLLDTVPGPGAGYLVAPARKITDGLVTRMVREAPGRPWLALPEDRCRALGLRSSRPGNPAMAGHLEPIEASEGVTTGISSADRARTMRVAADPRSGPADVVTPGHVVVVRVGRHGVAARLAPAEAGSDLAALAGFEGGAAMCEILEADGRLASAAAAGRWAAERSICAVTSFDVLDARLASQPFVVRDAERQLQTAAGPVRAVSFRDLHAEVSHHALLAGATGGPAPAALHVVVQDPLVDAFSAERDHLSAPLEALRSGEPAVVLYLSPALPADGGMADEAVEAQRSLLAAKRQAHLIAQLLAALEISSVRRATD